MEDTVANRLLERITSVEADPGDGLSYDRLKEQLERLEAARGQSMRSYQPAPVSIF